MCIYCTPIFYSLFAGDKFDGLRHLLVQSGPDVRSLWRGRLALELQLLLLQQEDEEDRSLHLSRSLPLQSGTVLTFHFQCCGIRIRIRRIHMFLGLLDPDPLVRGMDPGQSSSKNSKKNLILTVLWLLFDFLSLKNDIPVNVHSKSNKQKTFFKLVFCWRVEG